MRVIVSDGNPILIEVDRPKDDDDDVLYIPSCKYSFDD